MYPAKSPVQDVTVKVIFGAEPGVYVPTIVVPEPPCWTAGTLMVSWLPIKVNLQSRVPPKAAHVNLTLLVLPKVIDASPIPASVPDKTKPSLTP